jgi:hypothetical protein
VIKASREEQPAQRSQLGSFFDTPGTKTSRANAYTLHTPFDLCSYLLQVRQPTAFRLVVCVTHVVPDDGLFSTDTAYHRHKNILQKGPLCNTGTRMPQDKRLRR